MKSQSAREAIYERSSSRMLVWEVGHFSKVPPEVICLESKAKAATSTRRGSSPIVRVSGQFGS